MQKRISNSGNNGQGQIQKQEKEVDVFQALQQMQVSLFQGQTEFVLYENLEEQMKVLEHSS
jgi:hypothetical protein